MNALDEVRRTPLHYAAEANKVGVLTLLIESGGKVSLRDGVKRFTVYQLASSKRTRSAVVTYSSPPYKTKPEDIEYLNAILKDQHILRKAGVKKSSLAGAKQTAYFPWMAKDDDTPLPAALKHYQESLFTLLSRIQEYGVASYQHIKRPQLYSGAWMESVRGADDLTTAIERLGSKEAVMRVFNVLSPYRKPLPQGAGEENAVAQFYEEGETEVVPRKEEVAAGCVDRERYVAKLEADVRGYQRAVAEKDAIMEEKQKVAESKKESEEDQASALEIEALEKQVAILAEELEKAHSQSEELQELLIQANDKCLQLQSQIQSNPALEQAKRQVASLERELQAHRDADYALRFKAGQTFLEAIEQVKERVKDKTEESREFDPFDDYVIIRLQKAVEGGSLSLQQRLASIDSGNSGAVSEAQFTKFLELLQTPPQDVMALLKLGQLFENAEGKIAISDFVEHINKRHKLREEWEKQLFERVLSSLSQTNLNIADIFGFFDNNKDGAMDYEEMVAAFNALKISLPRQDLKAVFAVLDKDMNGLISLEEFEERLMLLFKPHADISQESH